MFLAGVGLTTVGGFIRVQCYRTLGRFFTFELTIQDDHQLVTSGPYGYVRHPSYTGALAALFGVGVCYGSRGSWLRECRGLDTIWGKAGAACYMTFVVGGLIVALVRPCVEDALLRERFGEQWDEWAKRVPYKLIPYIY